MGFQPTVSGSIDVITFQVRFVGKPDRMDQEIDPTPSLIDFLKESLNLCVISDVTR